MYLIKTYEAGSTIEVYKTYSKRYGRKIPRGAKKGRTPPDVMKVNDRNAEAELRRVLNANFRPKDYHLVLTYEGEQPPSQEEAKAALERFIRKCRAEYKREGLEFKYVAVTEYLHTRIHHHIVVPRAERLHSAMGADAPLRLSTSEQVLCDVLRKLYASRGGTG